MTAPTIPATAAVNPDAERIMLLAQLVSLRQECDALVQADAWAPDKGPLHARYVEVEERDREASRRLYHLGPPETPAGVQLVARLALERSTERLRRHGVVRCEYFRDWLVMAALQGITGIREELVADETLRQWLGEVEARP